MFSSNNYHFFFASKAAFHHKNHQHYSYAGRPAGEEDRKNLSLLNISSRLLLVVQQGRKRKISDILAASSRTSSRHQHTQLQDQEQEQEDDEGDAEIGNIVKDDEGPAFKALLTVFGYVFFGLVAIVLFLVVYLLYYYFLGGRLMMRCWRSRGGAVMRTQLRQRETMQSSDEIGLVLHQQQPATPRTMTSSSSTPPPVMNDAGSSTTNMPSQIVAGEHLQQGTSRSISAIVSTNTTNRTGTRRWYNFDMEQQQQVQISSSALGDVNHVVDPFVFPRDMLLQQPDDDSLSSDIETATVLVEEDDLMSDGSSNIGSTTGSV